MSAEVSIIARPDWVDLRARCNATNAMQCLRAEVERDMRQANCLDRKDGRTFVLDATDDAITVTLAKRETSVGMPEPSVKIRFKDSLALAVLRDGGDGFSQPDKAFDINLKWDSEGAKCSMSVNGDSLEPWQVSQKALEPLFFGS